MNFKNIQKLHKKLQVEIKENKTLSNKVFIRHWNILYNQIRGRDLSLIEKTSHTTLYNGFLKEISEIIGFKEFKEQDCSYSSNNQNYRWLMNSSSLFKTLKSEEDHE